MDTAALVLVLLVLLLGAIVATVGDRIGTKVGKARVRLFNLRPRTTATLITILTGCIISALSFGLLFAFSESLRKGVFELDDIQKRLRRTRSALESTSAQKAAAEAQLNRSITDQKTAKTQLSQSQKQLSEVDRSLKQAIAERTNIQTQKARIETELGQTRNQLTTVSQQARQLRTGIAQLQAEQRNAIAERNEAIQIRDQLIRERRAELIALEQRQEFLLTEVERLERIAQGLRQGNVAILRGQVLSSAVVRIVDPRGARQAVDQLLQKANERAAQLARPGETEQIIQITKPEVERLIEQIKDGQDYVVRISSAANYLLGETPIQVFAEALPNRIVFRKGDLVASTSLNPAILSEKDMQQRINLLLAAANFRANRLGILTDTVQFDRIQRLVNFVNQLKQQTESIEIRVLAANDTYTVGPLKVELVAEQNGKILFQTEEELQAER